MAKPPDVEPPESRSVTGELSASEPYQVAVGAIPTEDETQTGPDNKPGRKNGRLELAFTVSIAVVALAGAVIAWRAEATAQVAERYEQKALVAKANASGESHRASVIAQGEADRFRRWLAHTQAAHADLRAKRAAAGNSELVAQLDHDAAIERALANLYLDRFFPAYVVNQDHYDVAKRAKDIQLLNSETVDTAYQDHIEQAEKKRHVEEQLSMVGLMLLFGLTLLTLGHLQHRTPFLLFFSLLAAVLSGIALGWAAEILIAEAVKHGPS
jgi:hypothetical protein